MQNIYYLYLMILLIKLKNYNMIHKYKHYFIIEDTY